MNKACEAFNMDDPKKAWDHIKGCDVVIDYGSFAYDHRLHTWDWGGRKLCRCKTCGGLLLIQESEYHGPEDSYYMDFFPVTSEEEANDLNKAYNGFEIEGKFPGVYLMMDDDRAPHWSRGFMVEE